MVIHPDLVASVGSHSIVIQMLLGRVQNLATCCKEFGEIIHEFSLGEKWRRGKENYRNLLVLMGNCGY